MFSFAKQYQKISILPSQKGLEFPGRGGGGGGFFNTQKFKKICEVLLEFPEGWGGRVLEKLPSVGEVWILCGVTHCVLIWLTNLRRMFITSTGWWSKLPSEHVSVSIAWTRCQPLQGYPQY